MRRYLLSLLLALVALVAFGDEYKVTARVLNLRAEPSKSAQVIGVAYRGDRVEVEGFLGEWARISAPHGYAYAATQYLEFVSATPVYVPEPEKPTSSSSWLDSLRHTDIIRAINDYKTRSKGWLYACIPLLIILGCIMAVEFDEGEKDKPLDSGPFFYFCSVLFLGLCVCELMYFGFYYDDATWFCSPHEVGWIVTIIDFFLFCGAGVIQILAFTAMSQAAHYHGNRNLNCIPGLIGVGLAFVAMFLAGAFWEEYTDTVSMVSLVALGLWLLWMVIVNIRDSGSWPNLIYAMIIWCVGMLATMVMLAHLVVLLLVAAAIALGISILGSGGGGSSGTWYKSSDGRSVWIEN